MKIFTRKRITYGIVLVVIAAGVWYQFFRHKEPNVETLTLHPTSFIQQVSVAGTITAAQNGDLGFGQTGTITHVNVKPGDFVRAGTVLASLDNNDLQADVLQKISLLQAEEANLQIVRQGGTPLISRNGGSTVQTSFSGGSSTPASRSALIDAQQAQVSAAEADVVTSQATLNKTLIIAPFDGVVARVDAKVGEVAAPSTTEVSLESGGLFQIESYVPELDIANVKVGQPAAITLDAYGSTITFDAMVIAVDPGETIRDNVPTYKVTLQFQKADPRLKSGLTANVLVTTTNIPGEIVVPLGAVIDQAGKKVVQVKVGKTVATRPVSVGRTSSFGQMEITSGLKNGDELVLNPTGK